MAIETTDPTVSPQAAGDDAAATPPAPPEATTTEITFPVTGMTCASCVRRIEKRVGKVDGVQDVSVNLATEKARVTYNPAIVGVPDLVSAVEKAGYGVGELPTEETGDRSQESVGPAALQQPVGESIPGSVVAPPRLMAPRSRAAGEAAAEDRHARERQREIDDLKRKSLVSLAVGVSMMALMYLPLNLDMMLVAPVLLIAATIVQVWAGAGFYRAAWAAARHGSTNMNTLVAVGTDRKSVV